MKTFSDISKKTKLYQEVDRLKGPLVYGNVLCIDPSIGSSSSSPGWAYYQSGQLIESGTIHTGGSHLELWQRARRLANALHVLCAEYRVDVLVYEDIPATSGFNQNAIASLLKAVGIVLACTTSSHVLGVHPASWKNYVRPEYKKGDKEDAIEIGWVAIGLARYIESLTETTARSAGDGNPVSSGSNRGRRRSAR
jgi:hypothetical protein